MSLEIFRQRINKLVDNKDNAGKQTNAKDKQFPTVNCKTNNSNSSTVTTTAANAKCKGRKRIHVKHLWVCKVKAIAGSLPLSGAFVLTCKQQLTAHAESQSSLSLLRSLALRSLAASSSPSFYMEIAHTQHAVINANNNNNNCVTTPKKGHGIARQVNSLSLSYSILYSFNCNLLWMACWSHSSYLLQFPLRLAFLMKNLKNIYDLLNILFEYISYSHSLMWALHNIIFHL